MNHYISQRWSWIGKRPSQLIYLHYCKAWEVLSKIVQARTLTIPKFHELAHQFENRLKSYKFCALYYGGQKILVVTFLTFK
jgi:hypothetical protein